MPVNIHNKDYYTVAERIANFRTNHPEYTVSTELVSNTQYVIVKASILNGEQLIATGYAEEERDSSNINRTSAVENCETSAVGRALAFFGLAGTEIASADEVANAIQQQAEKDVYAKTQKLTKAILDHYETIQEIKKSILDGVLTRGAEAWFELENNEKAALWVAPSKGGPFTTKEREVIKSSEFRKAHYGEDE